MKKGILILGLAGLIISSCIEHEVIPAPVPVVELDSHFQANVCGSTVEFTENVLAYANSSVPALYITPQGVNSTAVYFSTMSSTSVASSISVGLGSVYWDATNTTEGRPTLPEFNNFYSSPQNQIPSYSDNGVAGFTVSYVDGNGREWVSSENSTNAQTVEFINVKQESGDNGDYNLFQCNFSCYVYSEDQFGVLDSCYISNAEYLGWFKR